MIKQIPVHALFTWHGDLVFFFGCKESPCHGSGNAKNLQFSINVRLNSAKACAIMIFGEMRGISSVGRARGSQSRGQGFDPPMLHQKRKSSTKVLLFLFSKDRGVEPERAERSGGPFWSEHARGERRTADRIGLQTPLCSTRNWQKHKPFLSRTKPSKR